MNQRHPQSRHTPHGGSCSHYPNLVGRGATRACVERMFTSISANLLRWRYTLTAGPQPRVQQGQFRHTQTGQLLRARQAANTVNATVPARVFAPEEPRALKKDTESVPAS